MKYKILFLLSVGFTLFCNAQDFFDKADAVFSTYVKEGKVDYKALKANPGKLNTALKAATAFSPKVQNAAEYQAFWVNAYNLAVLKGVVDKYPIKSPLDVGGFFDKMTYDLGGTSITLNDLENKKLRAEFPNEARFHFVLVCAGLGCPPLINKAYRPDTIEAQMKQQTSLALNNPNFIKPQGKKVLVSEIFKWYQVDFDRNG